MKRQNQILENSITANPENAHLRWARNDDIEHVQVIVDAIPENIVARLALIKELLKLDRFDEARTHLLVLQEQGVVQHEQAMGLFNGAINQIDVGNARVARAQVIGLDNVLKPTRAWQHSQLEVAGAPGTIGHPIREFLNTAVPEQSTPKPKTISFTKNEESVLPAGKKRILLVESPTHSALITASDTYTITLVQIDWNNDRKLDIVSGTTKGRVYIEGGDALLAENGTAITALIPWDADQDGDLDLLVSRDNTFLLRNNGDGSATVVPLDSPLLHSTAIIDIDQDGAVDLVGISENRHLVVLKNERSGRIRAIENTMPDTLVFDLVVGDFNNDGWMDIAWLDTKWRGSNWKKRPPR